jgi:hypothetical protein
VIIVVSLGRFQVRILEGGDLTDEEALTATTSVMGIERRSSTLILARY